MINLYRYVILEDSKYGHFENEWIKVSEHSQLIDAEAQLQRCLDSGIPIEQLKIEQETTNE